MKKLRWTMRWEIKFIDAFNGSPTVQQAGFNLIFKLLKKNSYNHGCIKITLTYRGNLFANRSEVTSNS